MQEKFDLIWNGYTICPKNWGRTLNCELFHLIYYVYGGEASYIYKGIKKPFEPGKLYLFPVFQSYTLQHNPQNPFRVLWFHVETDLRLCDEVTVLEIAPGSVLSHLLEALRLLSNNNEKYDQLLHLFGSFLMVLEDKIQIIPPLGAEMRSVITHINNHINQPMDIVALAKFANMERSYFCRKFKEVFKTTPSRYILGLRMKQATKALLSGATVYAAARSCGYQDEKSFSRAFKRYMEISPAKYRNERIIRP